MGMIEFHAGGMLAMLDKLPAEIHAKAIRPAAQAGAQVLYDEVRMRVPQSAEGAGAQRTAHSLEEKRLRKAADRFNRKSERLMQREAKRNEKAARKAAEIEAKAKAAAAAAVKVQAA